MPVSNHAGPYRPSVEDLERFERHERAHFEKLTGKPVVLEQLLEDVGELAPIDLPSCYPLAFKHVGRGGRATLVVTLADEFVRQKVLERLRLGATALHIVSR